MGEDSSKTQPEERHEHSDVNIRAIAYIAIAMIVSAAVILSAVLGIFKRFVREDVSRDAVPVFGADQTQLPPEPRLQIDPNADYRQFLKSEEETLNSYGWIDRQTGIVRIPIDRAIDLVAQRNLEGKKP
jgi:hypothetical protein